MFKNWRSLFTVVVALVVSLVGPASAAETVTLLSTQFSPIQEQQFVRDQILKPFTKETGISVSFVTEDAGPLIDQVVAQHKAGHPKVQLVGSLQGDFPVLSAAGTLDDLSSRIQTLPDRTLIPQFVQLGKIGGEQAFVPWAQATYLMVADKKALPYLPTGADLDSLTYDQLLAWAKNMAEATGSPKLGFPAGPKGLFGRFLHGYLYPSFTGSQTKAFASPAAVAMWQYLRQLFTYVNPSSLVYEQMSDPLLLGEVWVAWDHTARMSAAIKARPDDFVVFPAPAGPKGRGFISVLAGLGVVKGAPNEAEAWQLVDYLTRPAVQAEVLQGTGFFPIVKEAAAAVPEGPLKNLAHGVTTQASEPDALVALLPAGLGSRSGEYIPLFADAFQAIVINNEPIQPVLDRQAAKLQELYKATGAPPTQP